MYLYELLNKTPFKSLERVLINDYHFTERESLLIYNELKELTPVKSDSGWLTIHPIIDLSKETIDASYYIKEKGQWVPYSFLLEERESILGYRVHPRSLIDYTGEEILGIVISEMTFFGVDQDTNDKRKAELQSELEEASKESREHPEILVPLEDLANELGIDYDINDKDDWNFEEEQELNKRKMEPYLKFLEDQEV